MKKVIIFIALFLVGAIAILYPYRYEIFQFSAESIIKKNLPAYVTVKAIIFDLKNSTVKVEDLRIKNPPGYKSKFLAKLESVTCRYEMKGKNILDGIRVTKIVANNPLIEIERLPDGRINTNEMDKVMGSPKKPAEPKAKEEEKPKDKSARKISDLIELPPSVDIKGGRINFLDRFITRQPYSLTFEDVSGTIDMGLSDDYTSVLSVGSQGSGFINGDRTERIDWVTSLDPTAKALTMANKCDVNNIDITLFKPYYDEYSPVVIQKGKCSGTLIFNFDNGSIGSTNTVRLKDFVFEEKKSSRASQYWAGTISEVIKYLESSSGEIIFDFKIKGDMKSPQFYPGPHVKAAMQNMVVDKITETIKSFDQKEGAQQAAPGEKSDVDKVADFIKGLMKD